MLQLEFDEYEKVVVSSKVRLDVEIRSSQDSAVLDKIAVQNTHGLTNLATKSNVIIDQVEDMSAVQSEEHAGDLSDEL